MIGRLSNWRRTDKEEGAEGREKMAESDGGGEWVRDQCSYSWLQVKLEPMLKNMIDWSLIKYF